jgi:uroporphyrinogen-III synthase
MKTSLVWLVSTIVPLAVAFVPASRCGCTTPPLLRRTLDPVASAPRAFLTREDGKNGELQALLAERGVPCDKLPCIAFERLPGFHELQAALSDDYGWIVVTSPEAASVVVAARASTPAPAATRIACVGVGTARVLASGGAPADFVPSKATGKCLAAELPPPPDGAAVLYPASARAGDQIEAGLAARQIATRRIDTYTTVPAAWTEADYARARGCSLATFASPSAVRVWAERVGTAATAVCIGETSAAEVRAAAGRALRSRSTSPAPAYCALPLPCVAGEAARV